MVTETNYSAKTFTDMPEPTDTLRDRASMIFHQVKYMESGAGIELIEKALREAKIEALMEIKLLINTKRRGGNECSCGERQCHGWNWHGIALDSMIKFTQSLINQTNL
jgi:hypothetical protein